MPKKSDTPEDREAQLKAFQDAAGELECDDDPKRFDERLRKLAKAPAIDAKPKEPGRRSKS